jgi:hypothetical protein
MVTRAATKGRTTSAKTVQASQIFSQAHFLAYFMGIVKLAFVTPAMMRVAIPLDAPLMIASLRSPYAATRAKLKLFSLVTPGQRAEILNAPAQKA